MPHLPRLLFPWWPSPSSCSPFTCPCSSPLDSPAPPPGLPHRTLPYAHTVVVVRCLKPLPAPLMLVGSGPPQGAVGLSGGPCPCRRATGPPVPLALRRRVSSCVAPGALPGCRPPAASLQRRSTHGSCRSLPCYTPSCCSRLQDCMVPSQRWDLPTTGRFLNLLMPLFANCILTGDKAAALPPTPSRRHAAAADSAALPLDLHSFSFALWRDPAAWAGGFCCPKPLSSQEHPHSHAAAAHRSFQASRRFLFK